MKIKIIEASNVVAGGFNYGKFLVGQFDTEWEYRSVVSTYPLLASIGWAAEHILVLDLQTGEGAIFRHGGWASADLNKRKVWVCPLFEPFLAWLYTQDVTDVTALPAMVEIENPESAMQGYRRPGATDNDLDADDKNLVLDALGRLWLAANTLNLSPSYVTGLHALIDKLTAKDTSPPV